MNIRDKMPCALELLLLDANGRELEGAGYERIQVPADAWKLSTYSHDPAWFLIKEQCLPYATADWPPLGFVALRDPTQPDPKKGSQIISNDDYIVAVLYSGALIHACEQVMFEPLRLSFSASSATTTDLPPQSPESPESTS